MYEASMQGNTIVVQNTHATGFILTLDSAIIRIKAELERCSPKKLIWFLAPTVALCEQQYGVLSTSLPAVQIRLLLGSDSVDHWSEQRIWDIVLDNFKIVVSTHAVLTDALGHGFVTMDRLSLLVFDEAHHCARGHPANKIMTDHYHPLLRSKGAGAVPSILGLTASPTIRSKASDLSVIERNLNAACRTPRVHRLELLKHVHRPEFIRFVYTPNPDNDTPSALSRLRAVSDAAETLAWRSKLTSNFFPGTQNQMFPSYQASDLKQLKQFHTKACHIHQELGGWASEYYIYESIRRFSDAVTSERHVPFRTRDNKSELLFEKLQEVILDGCSDDAARIPDRMGTSEKVQQLIQFLTTHDEAKRYGIIFVEQRATVAVLDKLLSTHPMTKDIVKCSTFVGTSTNSRRRTSIGDWLDSAQQQDALESFRRQDRNLIIATSVLEEGIDISACNVVICFNKPANLKSFIQRRGRARKEESIFVLMLSSEDEFSGHNIWEALEKTMMEAYQQDAAERQRAQRLEDIEEHSESRFEIECTGALLTFDEAVAHIYHFCATLPPQPYVDMRPTLYFREDVSTKLITAILTLPNCVDPSVRRASSQHQWRTERMAVKDAAFQAYIALHRKGLVNDNLLPLLGYDEEMLVTFETRDAFKEVSQTYDSWLDIAKEWMKPEPLLYRKVISIKRPGQQALSMDMIVPRRFTSFSPYTLYWDEKTKYTVCIHEPVSRNRVDPACLPIMRQITATILRSVHSSRMTPDKDDFLVLFLPSIDQSDLASWLEANTGEFPASDLCSRSLEAPYGLIREPSLHGAPHTFREFEAKDAIKVVALPKRRDFLHHGYPVGHDEDKNEAAITDRKTRILPVESSTVDKLSLDFVECSLLIPSVLHQLWRRCLALDLSSSFLEDVKFSTIEYIITATNAPSANETTNYQRLEFFGDSILKFLVSIHLYKKHTSWPEGYLSRAKDRVVGNSRLARAGAEAELDRYIVTKPFTARKWTPEYVSHYSQLAVPEKRTLSTKVLADVVEALIGGAFLDGGLEKAAVCASLLLPEIPPTLKFNPPNNPDSSRSSHVPDVYLSGLESFLGYKFRNSRLLREALTHPSCQNDADTLSYQRLEFVGDAALDMLVISYLTDNASHLPHGRMHLIKAAMVNAGFLAYLCLNASVEQDMIDVHSGKNALTFEERRTLRSVNLCRFMQHQNPHIETALSSCDSRFERMRSDIRSCLEHEPRYPWVLLTSLAPEKFLSDIIESIFGAILMDSAGELQACNRFAERIGLLKYLSRVLDEEVDLRHPKTILSEVAGDRIVEYNVGVQEELEGYSCTIKVGAVEVATVFNGSSSEEVMTRAANTAIKLIAK
ncbi:MAG: hypothetical protein M1825_002823 [Sarcosagium campestre]|nr:MAG: hypothetical protein M1825_002823 [Sarcosagium campestre]